MVILSVDIGKARTGLAICDNIACEKQAQRIVVGLPKNMDGSEGDSAVSAREFAKLLSGLTDIPVVLYDERCTTMIAHRYLNDSNTRGKKRKQTIDAAAAAIILQSYIDFLKNSNSNQEIKEAKT